jgi:monomeric sarcosine oxidase
LPDEYEVLYDKFGGVLFSERCLQSYKAASLLQGATLLTGGELKKVTVQVDGITVEWGTERITAASLVITMGAGTGPFLRTWFPEWQIPLQPVRKTVAWFQASPTDSDPVSNLPYKANEFPGFLIESEKGLFYGFPDFGEGVKVGRHDGGEPCDMDSVNRDFFANPEDERELRHFLRKFFPEATEFVRGSVCMYTLTPDEHFVIDFHPEYGNVVLGAGFSGHGFKFASVVGEVLGCMATKEGVPYDLSLFRADRWESPRR